MLKQFKILKTIFIISISSFLFISCSTQTNDTVSIPFETNYNNFKVNVEYTKYYPNYLITKYSLTLPENNSIDENDIAYLSTSPNKFNGFGIGSFTVSSNKISSNKIEVIDRFMLPESIPDDSIDIQYSITQNNSPTKKLNLSNSLSLSKDNYIYLNKKIKVDNISFNLTSLANFEFGSIIDFYTENINNLSSYDIDKNFKIKLVSSNFTKEYKIQSMFALKNDYIKKIAKNKNFNPDSKYTEFFSCNMIYDPNLFKHFNLYLINKETDEEFLLFSNLEKTK